MTDRGKRIPLEKRINLRVIMGRAAFAVVAAAVFWLSGRAPAMAAQEPEEGRYGPEIRITRNVEPAEDGEFQEPPDRYWDGDGKEYRLDYWEILTIPGQDASRHLERKMVYTGVEGAEGIPGSISLKEDVSGSQAEGTLFLRESRIVREEWKDGFTAPVTFHAYGADEYHGGSLVIPGDAVLETCVSMGGKLLEFMGLSPMEYRILYADWSGEPYEDEEGRMCRQAMVRGQKLLRDYEAAYAQEAGHVPAPEVQDEGREGNLWYWVRSGFVITVGAGLIGISVGLLALLAAWYRQNRREHRRRCLPRIKG